jgi:adenylate cyclase
MRLTSRLTLGQLSALSLVALALLLSGLFVGLLEGYREAIVLSSGPMRDTLGDLVGGGVDDYLGTAENAVTHVERRLLLGTCSDSDPRCVSEALFTEILHDRSLAEVAFTHRSPAFQKTVSRLGEKGRLTERFTHGEKGAFVAEIDERSEDQGLRGPGSNMRRETSADPTLHPTFVTPASAALRRQLVWSDLSYLELDNPRPESERRVVVTVMKAVLDPAGEVVGVIRAALLEERLDRTIKDHEKQAGQIGFPVKLFIADGEGRLITRLAPSDPLRDVGEDTLRVVPKEPPSEISRALSALGSQGEKARGASFELGGRRFLVSYKDLTHSLEWHVGVVVAEDSLKGISELRSTQKTLLKRVGVVIAIIFVGGTLALRTIRKDLARIVFSTKRMGDFDFAQGETGAAFKDVATVMEGLERAKTALRALGKYVPIDLVRLLYGSGREPALGGELHDVTVMFTDLKGFTSLAEGLSPDELARLLGRYFEVMTQAIQGASGTVDKFIGDAVMALWNVPLPNPDHPVKACEAALACIEATERLYRSAVWAGAPALTTRFGINRETVMVGHFGAPDRLSYTALGDGVNLASRLEGLNKEYGTTVLVTEAVFEGAKGRFAFRLLDRVAVKGKTRGVQVYELLGRLPLAEDKVRTVAAYGSALELYFARDFRSALEKLAPVASDAPSDVLRERCRAMLESPPPSDWDGVFVATHK